MISRKLGLALCVLVLSATANAAETWTGILVDVMCHAKDVGDHTRSCALSPRCSSTGFGLVLKDDTFLKFDEAGSAKALSVLKATKKETDLKAKVTGTREGNVVKVEAIELQ
jgi:hypothetical protein